MKNHWHEQVQHYVDGLANVEEAAALQEGMKKAPELRALYLDYMNLAVALDAAAEAATSPESGAGGIAAPLPPPCRPPRHCLRWLSTAAACAALTVFAMLLRDRNRPSPYPHVDAVCSSTQAAISRFSLGPTLPTWTSPTASMLDQPHADKGDL